jgi:hypothetical protein
MRRSVDDQISDNRRWCSSSDENRSRLWGADVSPVILVSLIGGPARCPVFVRTGASPVSDGAVNEQHRATYASQIVLTAMPAHSELAAPGPIVTRTGGTRSAPGAD